MFVKTGVIKDKDPDCWLLVISIMHAASSSAAGQPAWCGMTGQELHEPNAMKLQI
jgi:hypothetical protein